MVIVIGMLMISSIKLFNRRTKITKGPWTTGRTDILYWHSGYLNPWPVAACAAHNYGLHECWPEIDAGKPTDANTERQRYIETGTRTHNLNWTPLGYSGPQWGDNCIATMDPPTGKSIVIVIVIVIISLVLKLLNINTKIEKGLYTTVETDGWTYYTANQAIWTRELWPHALRVIRSRDCMISKHSRGRPDWETDI